MEMSVLEALIWEGSAQKLAVFYSEADWGGTTQTQDHPEPRVLAAGFPQRRARSPRRPLFISDSSTPKVWHNPGFPLGQPETLLLGPRMRWGFAVCAPAEGRAASFSSLACPPLGPQPQEKLFRDR